MGLAMFNPHNKSEVSTIAYEDTKGNAKCKNCGCLGSFKVIGNVAIRYSTYVALMGTMRLSSTVFQLERYLSKVANVNLPHLHVAPPLEVIPFEFCRDFQH